MTLNVFEPRYVAMVGYVLAGSRRFGMVGSGKDGPLVNGTEVQITECIPQHRAYPGLRRLLVQIKGKRIFRASSIETAPEGFHVGTVEYLTLAGDEAGSRGTQRDGNNDEKVECDQSEPQEKSQQAGVSEEKNSRCAVRRDADVLRTLGEALGKQADKWLTEVFHRTTQLTLCTDRMPTP